jgi:hypothetical protein
MTIYANEQLAVDYSSTIIAGIYSAHFAQQLDEGWNATDESALMRQELLSASNANLAVMLDWVTQEVTDGFSLLVADVKLKSSMKVFKKLYMVKTAINDIVEALIGAGLDDSVITGILTDVVSMVRRPVVPELNSESPFNYDDSDQIMAALWCIMSDGVVGSIADTELSQALPLSWGDMSSLVKRTELAVMESPSVAA